jgi:propanol-preferring alcohol dehydrogenase
MRSVTNMTRADARDFLALVAEHRIRPRSTEFALADGAAALDAVRLDRIDGAAVIFP